MGEYRFQDVTLHYREAGDGPPLVLLHAFPLSSAMWEAQIPAFSKSHRVLAPDFRGFGKSSLGLGPSRMPQLADDVVALLDHLAIPAAAIAGLSMGGYVALAMMRRTPGRVTGLVLCDTRAVPDTEEAKLDRETTANALKTSGSELLVERFVPKLIAPHASDAVRSLVTALVRAADPRAAAAALRGMAARVDSVDLLPRIAVPTLVVVGSDDTLTPPPESQKIASGIPGAVSAVIKGSGHLSNLEVPEEFNRVVGEFLARAKI